MQIKSVAKAIHCNIFEISNAEAKKLIDKKVNYSCEEKQLFVVRNICHITTAIDNSSGECHVETFSNENDAYIWLLGLKEAEPLQAAEDKLNEWY